MSTISVADFDEGNCAELPIPAFDYIGIAVAAARRGPGKLSETERTAIAIAFGVPYKMTRTDDGRTVITTDRCGIEWTGDKISVVTLKNDRGGRDPWLLRRELGVSDV